MCDLLKPAKTLGRCEVCPSLPPEKPADNERKLKVLKNPQ